MFVTAAWVGNRVIHLPSQLNRPSQLNPSYLSLGSQLGLSFSDGSAQADGFTAAICEFCATTLAVRRQSGRRLVRFRSIRMSSTILKDPERRTTRVCRLQVEKRFTNGLAFLAGYTLSRLMDNTSSGFSSFTDGGLNKYNQRPEWAVSGCR